MSAVRIVVCIDIDVPDGADQSDQLRLAYARMKRVLDSTCEIAGDLGWESSDEWFNCWGEQIDIEEIEDTRKVVIAHEEESRA